MILPTISKRNLRKSTRSYSAGVKIKVGVSPKSDVERVRIARRILGDEILLMVDINGNYTPDIALESLRAIAPYGIHWCEEPLPPTDVRGYAELRARSPVPIAAGEAFQTAHTFKRFTDARALDILQPTVTSCGGFGQARAIATWPRSRTCVSRRAVGEGRSPLWPGTFRGQHPGQSAHGQCAFPDPARVRRRRESIARSFGGRADLADDRRTGFAQAPGPWTDPRS